MNSPVAAIIGFGGAATTAVGGFVTGRPARFRSPLSSCSRLDSGADRGYPSVGWYAVGSHHAG
jgi:hypothetical protein